MLFFPLYSVCHVLNVGNGMTKNPSNTSYCDHPSEESERFTTPAAVNEATF